MYALVITIRIDVELHTERLNVLLILHYSIRNYAAFPEALTPALLLLDKRRLGSAMLAKQGHFDLNEHNVSIKSH